MAEIKIDKFDQIGIVVKDIEKAAEMYRALFNFKGDINIVEQDATVNCRGVDGTYKMKKIMDNFGGKQLEIVEIVDAKGPNLYSEFLDEGKEGLHHMGIYTKNGKEIIKQFKDLFNIEVAQVGEFQIGKRGHLTFTYLETREILGYYVELLEF